MADVAVLCYHAISPGWPAALALAPDAFERQIAHVRRLGYEGATFSDALARPPARRTVAVTFDDAYRSVLDRARPILDRHGIPATVFVPTGFAGSDRPMRWPGVERWLGGPHEPELRCMAWDELRELAAAGWEVGSHTVSHPHLTGLDDAALAAELADSRATLEAELGGRCRSLAYPYGDVDARVVAAARAAGYCYAGTLPEGRLHAAEPLYWPRIGLYHGEPAWRWRMKLSPGLRGLRASPLWPRA